MARRKKPQPINVPTSYGDSFRIGTTCSGQDEIDAMSFLFNEAVECLKHSGGILKSLEITRSEPVLTEALIGFKLTAIPKKE